MPVTTRRNPVLRPDEAPREISVAAPAPVVRLPPPSRPPVAAPRSWRVMNVVSRSRVLRDAVGAFASTRARARGYRWDMELAREQGTSLLQPMDVESGARDLRADGFCEGLILAPEVVEQLVTFALLGTCYGNSDPHCGFAYRDRARAEAATGRTFSLATYLFTDEVDLLIERVSRDRQLRAVIARYFGAPPVYLGRRMWWTLKTSESKFDADLTTCRYHYDRDDYRSVRVFFHLTAVDSQHGQHVVIRGSHRRKALVHQLALQPRTDANIERYYGAERITAIEGAAGTGFVEDTYCFHKATRPVAGDRLMLELGFGLRNHRRFPPPDRASASLLPLD